MSDHQPANVEGLEGSMSEVTSLSSGSLLDIPDIDDETESTHPQKKAKELDTEDFDPEKLQEQTRTKLATSLVLILACTLGGVGAYLSVPVLTSSILSVVKVVKEKPPASKPNSETVDKFSVVKVKEDTYFVILPQEGSPSSKEEKTNGEGKELITLIWTSQVTLVSGALGFYFGSKK